MIGCLLAGWEEVVGIELQSEYCELAEARLEFWADMIERTGSTDIKDILAYARECALAEDERQALIEQGQLELRLDI